jgi:hypothetical protein
MYFSNSVLFDSLSYKFVVLQDVKLHLGASFLSACCAILHVEVDVHAAAASALYNVL